MKGNLEGSTYWHDDWKNYFDATEYELTEKPKVTIVQDTPKSKKKGG